MPDNIEQYYKLLQNVNIIVERMKQSGIGVHEMIIILNTRWKKILSDRKTMLGIDLKYSKKMKTNCLVMRKNMEYLEFSIPDKIYPSEEARQYQLMPGELN